MAPLRYAGHLVSPDLARIRRAWRRGGLGGVCRLMMTAAPSGYDGDPAWIVDWAEGPEVLLPWELRFVQVVPASEA